MMPFDKRNIVSTITALHDKILLIITTLILKYCESNWISIMVPGLMCSVIASILSAFTVDSPQFQHDQGNYDESRALFKAIS